ncbi:MAG: hypothetical protein WC496_04955 [Phycisphaerae bacterium]|jgi:hypothetical protein
MELKRPDEVSWRYPYTVFRSSILYNLIPFAIFVSIAGLLVFLYLKKGFPVAMLIVSEAVILLFGLIFLGPLRKSFTSVNWLMRTEIENVFIKIRSYLNSHLPAEDKQIIELEYSEIKWVRQTRVKMISSNRKGGQTISFQKYIDICFNEEIPEEIKEAVEKEKTVEDSAKNKIRSKWHDYPVSMKDGNMLRIRFTGITPSAAKAVELFGERGVLVQQKNYEIKDTTGSRLLPHC